MLYEEDLIKIIVNLTMIVAIKKEKDVTRSNTFETSEI